MIVTDEMVEKAREAYDDSYPESRRTAMRAALEAVAPLLIAEAMGRAYNTARAQGMREAATIVGEDHYRSTFQAIDAILARAEEIDPK